jgi:CARDB
LHAASWAGIFLDGQATTLFGGTSLSGWNYISGMAAGGSVTASNSFSTAGLSLGDHTLTVKADYWNDATGMANNGSDDVAESNEGNNSTTIDFTVNAPVAPVLPDLDVDSITPNAASVILGSNFSFSYVIKDIGAGAVTAASWAGIFLDGQATTLFGGTSTSGWNHIGPMAAGGAVTALNSFSTAGLSLGDHTLTVKADYWNDATGLANSGNNDVAESNEANNATTIHFTVNAATLLVQGSNANAPVTIAAGQTVDISAPYSGAVTFAADTGTLRLDDPASFAGTVAGMTGQDTIDFAKIDPAKVQPPSYDPSSGKLHVTDGTNSANIALLGNYMSSVFVASDDGHGGTSVVDPPALSDVQPLVTPPHA